MATAPWWQRFLRSTRGQLLTLLRRGPRTVDELAQALDLTDNAVRAHLATLERDGLVVQRGVRRGPGSGKPAHEFVLASEAERLFPKPYGLVLRHLLDSLRADAPAEELERAARDAGHRLAAELRAASTGDTAARLGVAASALNALGGLAEVAVEGDCAAIRGFSCPLAEAVTGHPEVCLLAETLVSDVAGIPVRERCDRGEGGVPPRCCFEAVRAESA